MTRVLCLGNNTTDTDVQTRVLAEKNQATCHGLLSELDQSFSSLDYSQPGYYHTSVVDIQPGNLKELVNNFDQVIMLDQPITQWNHIHEFYNTISILKTATTEVEFLNPTFVGAADVFTELTQKNKSFCIFPFIELHPVFDHLRLCCRSFKPVTNIKDLKSFSTDPNYQQIRKAMLNGTMLPEYCSACYDREKSGIASARLLETTEWAYRLGIKTVDDLKNINTPAFYDLRPSNKCNLTCRICNPKDSHLVANEYKKLNIQVTQNQDVPKHQADVFDLVEFDNIQKLLVAGGEPTIMQDFFAFLEKCISTGNTDFEINITTNGTTLSDRLKDLLKQFKDVSWVFSIDGYKDINYYSRYPSNWDDIVTNWKYHQENKNPVTVNTTISIYNIDSLDLLFQWIDINFPNTLINCMELVSPVYLNPMLFPDRDSVLQSLSRVMLTACYKNNIVLKTTIDSLYQKFQDRTEVNELLLQDFFEFNDKLDQNRKIYLKDYVPRLEKYRKNYDT